MSLLPVQNPAYWYQTVHQRPQYAFKGQSDRRRLPVSLMFVKKYSALSSILVDNHFFISLLRKAKHGKQQEKD